jgi:hypothetical protein
MLAQLVLDGFYAVMGVLIGAFVVGEVAHIFNERQANETYRNTMTQMAQTTTVAVESIKETTVTGINALIDMSTLNDVNALAQKKVEHNNTQANAQAK